MAMSKKKKIVIGIAVIIVVLAYAVLTAGVVVYNYRVFSGPDDIKLVEGLESDIYINPGYIERGIMFVGHYFDNKDAPYPLRVQIWDKEKKYFSITVNKITVTYSDGKVSEKNLHWEKELILLEDIAMLSDHIPDVVEEYMDCTINIEGFLITVSGEKESFSSSAGHFEYEKRSGIMTYIQFISNI